MQTITCGIREMLELITKPKVAELGFTVNRALMTGCSQYTIDSDPYWGCLIRRYSTQIHSHFGGSCKLEMSADSTAVVNDKLLVKGVGGLRIGDASVMLTIPRGKTASTVQVIAYKAADFIIAAYP